MSTRNQNGRPAGVAPSVPLWQQARSRRATPEDILGFFGCRVPPVDPFWIAEQLGVTVRRDSNSLDDELGLNINIEDDGEWGISPDGVAYIRVNPDASETRQRFTCAHELGHIILGHPPAKRNRLSSLGINTFEVAANRFAADFLMPSNWVRAYRQAAPEYDLASIFNVSPQAMEIRLGTLRY